jgi:hypothetical protein
MSLFTQILDQLGLKMEKAGAPHSFNWHFDYNQTKQRTFHAWFKAGAVANPAASGPANPGLIPHTGAAAPAPISEVDVVKKLDTLSTGKGLNWKTSIVDLLKFLDLDSRREARTELAKELHAPAEVMNDSTRMNTWLHKEVLRKIAVNGGNIPQGLLN